MQVTRPKIALPEDIANGKEKFPVKVCNFVDYSKPDPFNYTNECVLSSEIAAIATSTASISGPCTDCSCVSPAFEGTALCMREQLAETHGECGPACACPKDSKKCRPTQQLCDARFEVYKTYDHGWGVRSKDKIPRLTFIAEYTGEVFLGDPDLSEAPTFATTYNGEDATIDATNHGNITRFINHSCEPNTFAVKIERRGDSLAHIALFSLRTISKDEPLTISYGDPWWSCMREEKNIVCKCQTPSCKYPV